MENNRYDFIGCTNPQTLCQEVKLPWTLRLKNKLRKKENKKKNLSRWQQHKLHTQEIKTDCVYCLMSKHDSTARCISCDGFYLHTPSLTSALYCSSCSLEKDPSNAF